MKISFPFLRRVSRKLERKVFGFTLIELLVVVGIIMVVAASTLLVLDQTDDQARFDKTKQGYKEVHTALFGPGMTTTLSGNLVISGYLADNGKLPDSIDDLVVPPSTGNNTWSLIVNAAKGGRISHGWRGPYLTVTDTGVRDAWGNTWRLSSSDWGILDKSLRYRAGYAPPAEPPTLEVGSYGKNGVPEGSVESADDYDKDYPPTGITIQPSAFALTSVAIPTRTIQKQSDGEFTALVGVIYPGLYLGDPIGVTSVPPKFTDKPHPSLLRDSNGVPVTLLIPGKTTTPVSSGNKSGGGGSTTARQVVTPAGITFNLGYARQLQIVLYDYNLAPNKTNLASKVYAVDPTVFSYIPKVSTTGTEITAENVEASKWLTP